jgi:ABC-type transporter Mla MlaB component
MEMLRITVTETAVEERWILQGQLTKRSVAELVSSWRASLAQPPSRCRIVDLNEVTSIDKSGEEALLMMVRDGATFVASGVYTKHLLDQLQARQTNQQHPD